MTIPNYGVLRGKVLESKRESEQSSPHYQIHVLAGGTHFRVPVNVKSQIAPSELLFLVDENFKHPVLAQLGSLPEAFSKEPSQPGGIALDFIRGNLFNHLDMRLLPCDIPGPDNDLQDKIEHYAVRAAQDATAEIFAFGTQWAPENVKDKVFGFKPNTGVHNIHMNQGNDASFAKDDGVYQDGALLFHFPKQDQWVAIFLAFQSQAWHTDDKTGHAIAEPEPVDFIMRIVGALVNPFGPEPEKEQVILLNPTPAPVDLKGWAIADKAKTSANCLA